MQKGKESCYHLEQPMKHTPPVLVLPSVFSALAVCSVEKGTEKLENRVLPERSLTPVVMVAVNEEDVCRGLDGVKVTVRPSLESLNVPGTRAVPFFRNTVVSLIVFLSICLEKVKVTGEDTETPVCLPEGLVETIKRVLERVRMSPFWPAK